MNACLDILDFIILRPGLENNNISPYELEPVDG